MSSYGMKYVIIESVLSTVFQLHYSNDNIFEKNIFEESKRQR